MPIKTCNGLRLFSLPEPVTQVQNDAGKISSFCEPKRKAGDIELMGRLHKASQRRNDSPCDQDSRDPNARPDLVKHEVAGDLKQEVAPKEDSRSNPNCWLVMASSRFIVSAAKPRLILSMKATT